MTCGIYCIENITNNKKYIGYSSNIEKRIEKHFKLLKNNKHPNPYLQNAFNQSGIKNFVNYIIIECENNQEKLKLLEIYFIVYKDSYYKNNGYNLTMGGEGTSGYKYTPEQSERLSKSQKNRFRNNPMTDDHKRKISEKLKGSNNMNWGKFGKEHPTHTRMSGSANPGRGKFGSDHPTQKNKKNQQTL